MIWYKVVFLASVFLSLLLTGVLIFTIRSFGVRWQLLHKTAYRKRNVIPGLGGIAIYMTVWSICWCVYFFGPKLAPGFHSYLVGLFLATTLLLLLGIADDLRKLDYRVKFLAQITAGLILYHYGFKMEYLTDPFRMVSVPLGFFSLPITIFWHLLVINAINLIDGLDGLVTGICIVAFSVIIAVAQFEPIVTNLVCATLIGALFGFLPYNFYPAKIFLGDTGSQLLGQFLSAITLFSAIKSTTAITLTVPIALLVIPVINAVLIALVRLHRRKNPFQSQVGFHLHYKLIRLGFSHRETVLILYLASLCFGALALWMSQKANPTFSVWLLAGSVLFVVAVYFGIDWGKKARKGKRFLPYI